MGLQLSLDEGGGGWKNVRCDGSKRDRSFSLTSLLYKATRKRGLIEFTFLVEQSNLPMSSTLFGSSHDSNYDVVVKSIIIGDSSVGKSSLLFRYTDHDWNPHYIATIGVDFKVMTFERKSKVVKLQLWDTAGQERFRTITHSYYRGAHGVMVVFDVTSRESFENISTWLQDVKKYGACGAPMILLGNKCDDNKNRQVSDEEAQALAESIGCVYIPTSAKNDINVDKAFENMVDQCVQYRLLQSEPLKGAKRPALPPHVTKKKGGDCAC